MKTAPHKAGSGPEDRAIERYSTPWVGVDGLCIDMASPGVDMHNPFFTL